MTTSRAILLVREGESSARSAARHPARGHLTRYVGMEQNIYPDVSSGRVKTGDRFLLCTDGLLTGGMVPAAQEYAATVRDGEHKFAHA